MLKHALCAALLAWSNAARSASETDQVRSAYLQNCGGCHGVDGRSYAPRVPDLAGQAGYFLCTPQGRIYVARLPNVAFAHLDASSLAAVLNYVVFSLGAGSAPATALPYTQAEVATWRARPLDDPDMMRVRSAIIAGILPNCPGAKGLLAYGHQE